MKKEKKSLVDISFVSVGNIINAGFGFMFLASVAKILPIDDFGKYALLTTLLVSISRFLDFGTDSLFVTQESKNHLKTLNAYLSAKTILFSISGPIAIFALLFLDLFSFQTSAVFLGGLLAYGVNYTLFAIFQKRQLFHYAVILNTLPAIIKAFFATLMLTGLFIPTLLQTFSIFSFSMFTSAFLIKLIPVRSYIKQVKIELKDARNILKISYPAGISVVITHSWQAISNSIAKLAKDFADVGVFSLANKIANIFTLISLSIFTVLLPKNAHKKNTNQAYDVKEITFLSLGVLSLAVISTFMAKFFVAEFFAGKFNSSLAILDILIFASAFSAIHNFLENFFFVENKTSTMLKITLSKLLVFLCISGLYLQSMGLAAIAWAQLISSFLSLVITVYVLQRRFSIRTGSISSGTGKT